MGRNKNKKQDKKEQNKTEEKKQDTSSKAPEPSVKETSGSSEP